MLHRTHTDAYVALGKGLTRSALAAHAIAVAVEAVRVGGIHRVVAHAQTVDVVAVQVRRSRCNAQVGIARITVTGTDSSVTGSSLTSGASYTGSAVTGSTCTGSSVTFTSETSTGSTATGATPSLVTVVTPRDPDYPVPTVSPRKSA